MDLYAHPNNSPFPSQLTNSPFYAPFLQRPDGDALDMQPVPESTALVDMQTGQPLTPQGPNNFLAAMRHQFPYVAVKPFPTWEKTVFLTSGVPKDIRIPGGVVFLSFNGSAPWLLSTKGNAQLPTATDGDDSASIYAPNNITWYCGNVRSVSVIAPDTGTLVSVTGHRFTEMPR